MTDLIIPRACEVSRPRRRGVIDRALRRIFLDRLAQLDGGRIVLRDAGDTIVIGEASGDDALLASVTVHDPRLYRRIALAGSLGAADGYRKGEWSADDLPTLLRILVRSIESTDRLEGGLARVTAPATRIAHAFRGNNRRGSRRNIQAHYDLGNDFFALFLDETMTYSCGVFERPDATLAEASIAKLDRMCRHLDLGADDHVIEIGSGWGSFAIHAASRYGCRVTTTTISKRQLELARARVRDAGLADLVEVQHRDYRDLTGQYDKLASIEMIEAVGHDNLGSYFATCARLLRPGGRAAIQAITMPDQRYDQYLRTVDFIRRDVFPGSCVPSFQAIVNAAARATDLRIRGVDDISSHYAPTLHEWRRRFHDRRPEVRELGYTEELFRLWDFYMAYCEAGFAERYTGTIQILLEKPGR